MNNIMSEKISIPDTYSRALNFLCAVGTVTFAKLEKNVEDEDDIDDSAMTYKKTVELCLVAENRVKKNLSAMAMARKIRKAWPYREEENRHVHRRGA